MRGACRVRDGIRKHLSGQTQTEKMVLPYKLHPDAFFILRCKWMCGGCSSNLKLDLPGTQKASTRGRSLCILPEPEKYIVKKTKTKIKSCILCDCSACESFSRGGTGHEQTSSVMQIFSLPRGQSQASACLRHTAFSPPWAVCSQNRLGVHLLLSHCF